MSEQTERKHFRIKLNEMVKTIRTNIIMEVWKPGDYLPSEQALAKQFELSNLTVRKGLEALVEEGFIVKIPRVGNQVSPAYMNREIQIKFGYYGDLDKTVGLSTLIDEFQRKYPRIRVQPIPVRPHGESTYYETISESINQGNLDVVSINYNDYLLFKEQNELHVFSAQPSNPAVPRSIRQPFLYEDVSFAVPFIYSPVILCYNKAHFRQAGLRSPDSSWTWDELLEQAGKLNVKGERYGFYFFPLSYNRWPIFLLQNGFSLDRSSSPSLALSIDQLVEAMNMCKELFDRPDTFPAFLSDSAFTPEMLFAQGKISMIMTTYFHMNRLIRTQVEYDIAPLPYIKEPMTLLLSIGLAVNDRSEVKLDAQLFVDFLQSPEAQAIIRRESLSIPATRLPADQEVELDTELNRPSSYSLYRDIMPTYRLHHDMNVTQRELELILNASRLFWANLEDSATLKNRLLRLLA